MIYTNVLGLLPMMVLANVGHEYSKFWDFWWSSKDHMPPAAVALLVIGSLVGTGIGYSSWWARSLVSATSFTLVGVMNKCLTILVNVFFWDKHATPTGIFYLFVCISGGMIYQQAPMRGEKPPQTTQDEDDDDAFKSDIEKLDPAEEESLIQKDSNAKQRQKATA